VTDVSDPDSEDDIDVDDLHLVYRTALTMTLALSYGIMPKAGQSAREIMA
jgi:hypothetical protein